LNLEAAHWAQERAQGGEQLYVAAADGAPLGGTVEQPGHHRRNKKAEKAFDNTSSAPEDAVD
jgi:hypothetical protein